MADLVEDNSLYVLAGADGSQEGTLYRIHL